MKKIYRNIYKCIFTKCFKPSKCLPFGNVLEYVLDEDGVYTSEWPERCRVSTADCNGNFFLVLQNADSIVSIS